jgi:hypothetical protein
MDNILPYFLTTSMKKAQVAVLFQDIVGNGLKYAMEAKERGIPIVVVQHGRGPLLDYLPPNNHKLMADKICVWGTRDHKMMLEGGFDPDRVVLTGCPLFDSLKNEKISHKGTNILFAPGHSVGPHEFLHESNLLIMEQLNKIHGINIYIKLLSTQNSKHFNGHLIRSNSFDRDHIQKCIAAVRMSDILVSNQCSTIDLIAMYFGIPVISILTKDPKTHEILSRRFDVSMKFEDKTKAFGSYFRDDPVKLAGSIDELISNPNMLDRSRKEELLSSAGVGLPGSPVLKIIETIKSVAK